MAPHRRLRVCNLKTSQTYDRDSRCREFLAPGQAFSQYRRRDHQNMAIPADNSRPAPGAGEGVLSPAPAKSSPGRLMLTEMLAHLVFGKPNGRIAVSKSLLRKGLSPP